MTASRATAMNINSVDNSHIWLLCSALLLASIGVVMVMSASLQIAETRNGDAFFYIKRHAVYLMMAITVAFVVYQVPVQLWQKMAWPLLGLAIVALIVVLVPGIGKTVNGSTRWIAFAGFTVQPSEFAKFAGVVFLADYLARRQNEVRETWQGFLKPLVVLLIIVALLMSEPDFGASVVMMAAALGVIFLGGVKWYRFLALLTVSIASVAVLAVSQPYRLKRLISFTDPWADQFGSGYQLIQSLIAIGRGEWFGVGLGNSVQKLFYLPEAHTDFVFAVIAEELGLMGNIGVILLFSILIYQMFKVSSGAERKGMFFHAYLGYGIALLIAGQALINVGVNMGVLPTKGLTLPLVSYGGTSLIVTASLIAVVFRLRKESVLHALSLKPRRSTSKRAATKVSKKKTIKKQDVLPSSDSTEVAFS